MEGFFFDGFGWKPKEGSQNPSLPAAPQAKHAGLPPTERRRSPDRRRRSHSRERRRSRDRRRRSYSRSRDRRREDRRRDRSRDRRRSRDTEDRRRRRSREPAREAGRREPAREAGRQQPEPEVGGFMIKLCQDDEQGEAANQDYRCSERTVLSDIKRHLAPLCKDVPGFVGESDIILHRGDDVKLFAAMSAAEAGLQEGAVLKWHCVRRNMAAPAPETAEAREERLDRLEQQFGGTADPCTDRGFWLGKETDALATGDRSGEWFCPKCRAHNFAERERCCGCNLPRPQSAR